MDAFKAYKLFMAVKLHFTSEKYDVFQTNGRVSGSRAAFNKRNDRFLFEKLSNKFPTEQELIYYYVANFMYGNSNVVYSSDSDEYYKVWIKRKESRTQVFSNDLNYIVNYLERNKLKYEDLYSIEEGVPLLLQMYIGNHITLETMVILQDFENYLDKWDPLIMLWKDYFLTIKKTKKFIKYDKIKLSNLYNTFKETLAET